MAYPRIAYKNIRIVKDHSLGSDHEAEIFITKEPPEAGGFQYKVQFKLKHAEITETMIFNTDSIGRANLSVLNTVLARIKTNIENFPKNLFIYIDSEYVVNTVNTLTYQKELKAKYKDSKNLSELLTLKEHLQTVGYKHYILIKKEKIIKVYKKLDGLSTNY